MTTTTGTTTATMAVDDAAPVADDPGSVGVVSDRAVITARPVWWRRRAVLVGGVAVLAALGGTGAGWTVHQVEYSTAVSEYRAVMADVSRAGAGYAAVTGASTATVAAAKTEADALDEAAGVVPGELLTDPGAVEALTVAISGVRDALAVVPPPAPEVGGWATLPGDASITSFRAAAQDAEVYRAELAAAITASEATATRVTTALDTAHAALDGLVASAAAKGETLAYDRAGEGERDALTAAVAALRDRPTGADAPDTATTAGLLTAYVDAAHAAEASHNDAIAAEAAAAEAERAAAERATARSYSSNSGSSGGSGGGYSNHHNNSGGGMSSGGGSGYSEPNAGNGWNGGGMGEPLPRTGYVFKEGFNPAV